MYIWNTIYLEGDNSGAAYLIDIQSFKTVEEAQDSIVEKCMKEVKDSDYENLVWWVGDGETPMIDYMESEDVTREEKYKAAQRWFGPDAVIVVTTVE